MAEDSCIFLEMEKQASTKRKEISERFKVSSHCTWKWALSLYQSSNTLSNSFMHSSSGSV